MLPFSRVLLQVLLALPFGAEHTARGFEISRIRILLFRKQSECQPHQKRQPAQAAPLLSSQWSRAPGR
jgi:hypothetical protein